MRSEVVVVVGEGLLWPSKKGVREACRFPLQLGSGILSPTDPSTKMIAWRGCSIFERLLGTLQPGIRA